MVKVFLNAKTDIEYNKNIEILSIRFVKRDKLYDAFV